MLVRQRDLQRGYKTKVRICLSFSTEPLPNVGETQRDRFTSENHEVAAEEPGRGLPRGR